MQCAHCTARLSVPECACACVRACVHECACARVHASVCQRVCARVGGGTLACSSPRQLIAQCRRNVEVVCADELHSAALGGRPPCGKPTDMGGRNRCLPHSCRRLPTAAAISAVSPCARRRAASRARSALHVIQSVAPMNPRPRWPHSAQRATSAMQLSCKVQHAAALLRISMRQAVVIRSATRARSGSRAFGISRCGW
jgi:hypothetical protein